MQLPLQTGLFLLLISLWAYGGKKALPSSHPGQTADLEASKLVTAKKNCENWAVAAGIESMLKQQNVDLDQNFWVMRINGGELCVPDPPSADALAAAVNREFVVDGNRHVLLEVQYSAGAPDNPDALIAGLKQQRITLMLLRGHVFYLTGVTYNEFINADGSRMFVLTELRLANSFANQPGQAFVRGRDNTDDIGGIISISATPAASHW
jgi:hypothetical protein